MTTPSTTAAERAASFAPHHAQLDLPRIEEDVLELWARTGAESTSLGEGRDRPTFVFYDGPPFATGSPHYGHILAGTIKDVRTRFAHQTGFHVPRNFGWDTHGMPIEFEVDKMLGINLVAPEGSADASNGRLPFCHVMPSRSSQ